MLDIIKRYRFSFWMIVTFCLFACRVLYYYVNGQALASAHLDDHVFGVFLNIFISVILAVILLIVFVVKRNKKTIKWFLMPAIIIAFSPLHYYIGSLFPCCVCCCMDRYVHQWYIVVVAMLAIFGAMIWGIGEIKNHELSQTL